MPARPKIVGISHVALYCKDITASRAFYKDFLGFAEPLSLNHDDGSLRLTFIKVNDAQVIELFPEREPSGDRMYHLAVETDDAEAMRRYLQRKGVGVPPATPVGRAGNANFFIKDPDGNIVEIVQYLPDGATRRLAGKEMPATRISNRIRHGGAMVGQLEPALKFYGEVLGFKEVWRGSAGGQTLSWVHMKVPEGDDFIELMLYGDKPPTERIRTMQHLCLEVPDVQKAYEILSARKLPAGCKPPSEVKVGINGKRQVNYFDPDGTRVEIMEPGTVDGKSVPSSSAMPPRPTGP